MHLTMMSKFWGKAVIRLLNVFTYWKITGVKITNVHSMQHLFLDNL